jgi:hypothetical protein
MPVRGEMRPTPIAAGEQEVTVSVSVTYDLVHVARQ